MSRVIRSEDSKPTTQSAVIPVITRKALNVSDEAPAEVNNHPLILQRAREEADAIIAAAHAEAKQIRAEAETAGFDSGRALGMQSIDEMKNELERERQELLAAHENAKLEVTRLAEMVNEERQNLIQQTLRPLPQFCMEVISRLLHRELELAPANLESMVAEMIGYVLDGTKVEVRVNPSDYGVAMAAHPVWKSAKYGEWELVIVPDGTIEAGGCEVRSDVGRLDGTIQVKLELLQSELDAVFGGGNS